jgi:plastocyanin
MRRLILIVGIALLALPACGGGSDSASGTTRTILADYNYDEFPTAFMAFFPAKVEVHPGDTIDFKQAWTGEPHTVTLGTKLLELGKAIRPYILREKPAPADEPPEVAAAGKPLESLSFFGEDGLNQTVARPCYVQSGEPPTDGKPCAQKAQPAFNGREVLYNSGFIPYEGNRGNHFKMKLAEDLAPGEYFYMCMVHIEVMSGFLDVKPKTVSVPGQATINRNARKELDAANKKFTTAHQPPLAKKLAEAPPQAKDANIEVGWGSFEEFPFGFINEFYPKTFTAKVGQKVTWYLDYHTVSFNVPKYGPQINIKKDGTVEPNPKAYEPQGGPGYPKDTGPPEENKPPAVVDAGNYDGSKFLSSGVPDGPMLYSITFTKAGTYKYACLIHPPMIGTLVVK